MRESEKYNIIISTVFYSDDENDFEYVATFNEFPTIIGSGNTKSEALNEALDNLDVYLEYCKENSISIPTPKNNLALDEYSGKMTVRMPKMLHRDLAITAAKDGMSLNAIAIDAFRVYLQQKTIEMITNYSINKIDCCICDLDNTIGNKKVTYKQPAFSESLYINN